MLKQLKQTYSLDDVAIEPRYSMNTHSMKSLTVGGRIPVYSSSSEFVGTIEMSEVMSEKTMGSFLSTRYDITELYDFFFEENSHVIPTFGTSETQLHKWNELKGTLPAGKIKTVYLQPQTSAHNIQYLFEVGNFKDENPDIEIVAGPVSDPFVAARLIEVGATTVKVGNDSRIISYNGHTAGVGVGHASALADCVEVVHQRGGMVMASGYYDDNSDICKCFALGADFVELNETLIGHTESYGKTITDDGQMIKNGVEYRGSAREYISKIMTTLSDCLEHTGYPSIDELKNANVVLIQ